MFFYITEQSWNQHFLQSSVKSNTSFVHHDGFLYVHNKQGLFKMGTGCHGTLVNHIYASNPDYHNKSKAWLAVYKNKLYFRSYRISPASFIIINAETLQVGHTKIEN